MGYTPVELRHVKVGRSLLGYDRRKVEELLDDVANDFEVVWRDRGELADQVEDLQKQLASLQEREQLLSQTLVAAETAAVEVREQARREAELIVAEAHQEARAVSRNAQADRDRLVAEAKRIEGFLRGALGLIGEAAAAATVEEPVTADPAPEAPAEPEPVQIWPREESVDEALGLDAVPDRPPAPFLRRVAGGEGRDFDWGD